MMVQNKIIVRIEIVEEGCVAIFSFFLEFREVFGVVCYGFTRLRSTQEILISSEI